jgi:type IV pilus assembly protein PilM
VFLRSKQMSVGLDVGSSSVKVVRLAHSGDTAKLLGLAIAEINDAPLYGVDEREGRKERTVDAIRSALEGAGVARRTQDTVVTAIGGPQVSIRHVPFPKMSEEDLVASVQWEARKHVPFDTANAVIGYQLMDRADKEPGEEMQVLLTAAENSLVDSHIALLMAAGIEPSIVDLAPLALMNEVEEEGLLNGTAVAVVEIGRRMAHFSVYAADSLFLARSVPMPVAPPADAGAVRADSDWSASAPGDDSWPPRWLDHVIREMRFSLTFYKKETGRRGIEQILLAGGHALVPGAPGAFEESLGIPTKVLNPLEHITASSVDLDELSEQGPRFALAMGLARRS